MGIKPSPRVNGNVREKACLTQDKESREFLDSPVRKGTITFHSQLHDLLKTPFWLHSPHWQGVGRGGMGERERVSFNFHIIIKKNLNALPFIQQLFECQL